MTPDQHPRTAASSSIRRPSRRAGWTTTPTRSWTGWPPRASRGGRCCRWDRPTATARRTRRASAFAAWPGLLADPDAPVTRRRGAMPSARAQSYWIEDWIGTRGRGALEDQVRFDREWARAARVRGRARRAAARRRADLRRPGRRRPPRAPELFRPRRRRGRAAGRLHREGQLWGNPVFDWPALRRRGYRWWIERLRRTFELVDMTRIDHFRGFVAYWAVPEGARDAVGGRWVRGPGARAVPRCASASSARPTSSPRTSASSPSPSTACARRWASPGMVVLQFGFDDTSSTRTTRQPRGAQRRLHRHARPRHGERLVGVARPTRRAHARTRPSSAPASRPTIRGGRSSGSRTGRRRRWRWCSCRTSSDSGRRRG